MKKQILVLCSALLLSLSAFAAPAASSGGGSAKDEISPNQGSDMCGLGWQVTQNKTLLGTMTRGTTHYFLPPTFSMTTGTSGCVKHEIARNEVEGVKYVATNLDSLSAEMAQGSGEYVDGLARVMGCDESVMGRFGAMTQRKFRSIVSGDAVGTFRAVKSEIGKDPLLAVSCNAV
jgi:hypothetical protein